MKIIEKIEEWKQNYGKRTFFSLEFFPPKTETGVLNLYDRFDRFAILNPLWIDVTWGAGGSTAGSTLEICTNAMKFHGLEPLMHLTCTNVSKDDLHNTLLECKNRGIQNILALRGDASAEQDSWKACEGGFSHAIDLVKYIRAEFGNYFCIAVAGYPEGHLENPDKENDLLRLKEKVDAGADLILTQLFFELDEYFSFVSRAKAIGISVPIIPGILPIQSYAGFMKFSGFCKTKVPDVVMERLSAVKNDDQKVKDYGVELCIRMCQKLLEMNVTQGLHFYTLNLEVSIMRILDGLHMIDIHLPNRDLPWRPRNLSICASGTRVKGKLQTAGLVKQSSRELSARTLNGTNYNIEDVRPIFWSNRPKSYIQRTEGWDDFPNGRWGNRDSPAYGEPFYSMCTDPSDRSSQIRRDMWGGENLNSTEDVIRVFVNYLKHGNPTKRLPWTSEQLGEETSVIKKPLIKLNTHGLCTINSQPRVNGALSTDPLFGWGPRGGYVYQKAYIEFFCSPKVWSRIGEFLQGPKNSEGSLTFMAATRDGAPVTNCEMFGARSTVNAVTWGVFPNGEVRQPTVVDLDSFLAWKIEAFGLWLNEWASIYPSDSQSHKVLNEIQEQWFLVNIVDNNYLTGDLFGQLVIAAAEGCCPVDLVTMHGS